MREQRRRFGIFGAGLAVVLATLAGVCVWISQVALHPPRARVSGSARPVVGLVVESQTDGITVVQAVPPASHAGLRAGDRVVALDGTPLRDAAEFGAAVANRGAGDVVVIEARRPESEGESTVLANVEVEVRTVTPADLGLPYEDVAMIGARGRTLRGWFIPAPHVGSPAVAYGHGNAGDRRQWLGAARAVHDAGVAQLLFDFGGCGESDGSGVTLGATESEDLRAALRWLAGRREVDGRRLGLAGRSMGAVAAILAAVPDPGTPAVDALVLDSPFATLEQQFDDALRQRHLPPVLFRPPAFAILAVRGRFEPRSVRPLDDLPRIPADVLLVHGESDTLVPFEHARRLEAAARGSLARVELVSWPGLGHGSPRPPGFARDVARFLARSLGAGSRPQDSEHEIEIDRPASGS